ncbi:MAG: TrkA family potassium uptake protein [Coriobacteriales bacterium]|jgi:trk system potassium uptake protein TrkA|nr:TrkA family potassium uptake protein [Coriobacteriales bacterium]
MNIIIVGCGRVGSRLALLFSQDDHDVVVVDTDAASFAELGRSFEGRTVIGVGFDEETLKEAGIVECDVLAAVTDSDNSNIMIAEVARKLYEVPHVLARLYNPDRESAYLQLGLDYASGTTLVAEEMYAKIVAEHGGHVDTFGNYEILRFALSLDSSGAESIQVGELERDHEARIIAFERKDASLSSLPNADSTLYPGDVVLAAIHKDRISQFTVYMRG